jgi:signal peptidase II
VLIDQLTKTWVVSNIPENTVGFRLFGDFLAVIHVRNNAVAFSLGQDLSLNIRAVLFILIPCIIMVYIAKIIVSKNKPFELTNFQIWILAGFLGGGCGNLADRIFRHFRVVDFMSNRVYGLFGLERWPTWNFADATVCVCGVLMLLSIIIEEKNKKKEIINE